MVCLGYHPDGEKPDCKPCRLGEETWISLYTSDFYGVCFCAPRPLKIVANYSYEFGNIAIVYIVLLALYKILFRKSRRRLVVGGLDDLDELPSFLSDERPLGSEAG